MALSSSRIPGCFVVVFFEARPARLLRKPVEPQFCGPLPCSRPCRPAESLLRTCRCTPSENCRALIRRALRLCAALFSAVNFSLEPVYFCVKNLGRCAHLPACHSPSLPRVSLRALPSERQVPRQRKPQAPRRMAPRAVHHVWRDHQAHGRRADERARVTT